MDFSSSSSSPSDAVTFQMVDGNPMNPTSDYLSCSVDDYLIDNIQIEKEGYFSPQCFNIPTQTDDRILKLPPGVRFRPTDEELVIHYLQLEFFGVSSDSRGIIIHANIYDFHPHQLSGLVKVDHGDGKMYFYTRVKKIGKNSVRSVKSKSGDYWKATQTNKPIRGRSGITQGYKSSLAYYHDNNKTQWLMQEYKLRPSNLNNSSEELVLAVVYYHRQRGRTDDDDNGNGN